MVEFAVGGQRGGETRQWHPGGAVGASVERVGDHRHRRSEIQEFGLFGPHIEWCVCGCAEYGLFDDGVDAHGGGAVGTHRNDLGELVGRVSAAGTEVGLARGIRGLEQDGVWRRHCHAAPADALGKAGAPAIQVWLTRG